MASSLVAFGGTVLFTIIIIGVAMHEKTQVNLNASYPNEHQIIINHKLIDIKKENCFIDIRRKYENYSYNRHITNRQYVVRYIILIRNEKRTLKSFQITSGHEECLRDFIYNFEYEISDFKRKNSEWIKRAQNVLDELYSRGSVSKETLNRLNENRNEDI